MFTINIKGKPNPKDLKLVKLEMIFFKTGYNRATKIIEITGPVDEWDDKSQSFKINNNASITRNSRLFELKNQYHKIAEDWNHENRLWSPVELSRYLDKVEKRQTEVKSISVIQMFDSLIDVFTKRERYKNGMVVTSYTNARAYLNAKSAFIKFTQQQYGKSFSTYYFADINAKFLHDFVFYTKGLALKNSTNSGLAVKLRILRAVCNYAKKRGTYGIDTTIFDDLGDNMKVSQSTSRAVSHKVIEKIEKMDRWSSRSNWRVG